MAGKGAFFLGTTVDPSGKAKPENFTLDSSDLTTHGVIVGMTGSGKTGLGIVMLEEALLAGIPVLVLDPKGDMGNLALTFPDLSAAEFKPWVNESDATAAGLSVDDYAAQTASQWQKGLEGQGMGADRIKELRAAADVTIYTPGSTAGVPLNVVGSLRAPKLSWDTEAETLRDEIEGLVTSLLALAGIDAAPLSSREHVLLSNLIENAWRAGRDLDLGSLIGEIQTPPLRKLGVFEIDAFFPPKDRTELALKLNAIVAAPSFEAWGEGAALDAQSLLFTPEGKARAAIVYLAHLSDEERQFVVTLVLSKLVTWMRGQPGTSDLRVLSYMDEVFGFVPPTAAPPAKKPILTILKQGRAFGVGIVLATQNPVDLDYKAMSNAGTWLVGRLQTERDKARVLEGLRSAAGGTDVAALDAAIGGLEKRQFLLVSAKSSQPQIFATRWAMSYLRGPLTKDQVASLMKDVPRAAEAPPDAAPADCRAAPGGTGRPRRHRKPPLRPPTRRLRSRLPRRAASPFNTSTRPLPGRRPSAAPRAARACGHSWPRESICATTTRPPESTRRRSSRRSTARSTAASTSTRRPSSTTTTATSAPNHLPGATYVLPAAPIGAGLVLQGRRDRDQATAGRQARARDLPQQGVEAHLAARRERGGLPQALRRGGADRGGQGNGRGHRDD